MPELVPLDHLWKDGRRVRDVMLDGNIRSPLAGIHGAGAVGILSLIGPFLVERFAAALDYIVVSKKLEKSMTKINPIHVLSQPWSLDRVEKCMAKRKASPAPFIQARARVMMSGWPDLFLVTDGMHRSYTARRFGDTLIDAEISKVWNCDTSNFYLNGLQLMRGSIGKGVPHCKLIPPDIATILECLGCERNDDPESFTWGEGNTHCGAT